MALAETAFAGAWGLEADLRKVPSSGMERDDFLLFSESASRFVVTIHPENQKAFEACLQGNTLAEVGKINKGTVFRIHGLKGDVAVQADIFALKEAWQRPLQF